MSCQPDALIWASGSREWGSSTPWPKVRELRKINSGERGRGEGSGRILFWLLKWFQMQSVFNNFAESKGKEKTTKTGTWSAHFICVVTMEYFSPPASHFHSLLYPDGSTDPNSTQRCWMLWHTRDRMQIHIRSWRCSPKAEGLPGMRETPGSSPSTV